MNNIIISLGQNLAICPNMQSSAYQTLFWGNGIGHMHYSNPTTPLSVEEVVVLMKVNPEYHLYYRKPCES